VERNKIKGERKKMRKKKVIEKMLAVLESDERLKYPTATIVENAPLALIQLEMESKISVLKWVLNKGGK